MKKKLDSSKIFIESKDFKDHCTFHVFFPGPTTGIKRTHIIHFHENTQITQMETLGIFNTDSSNISHIFKHFNFLDILAI